MATPYTPCKAGAAAAKRTPCAGALLRQPGRMRSACSTVRPEQKQAQLSLQVKEGAVQLLGLVCQCMSAAHWQ